jgi:hypothetical protein
MLHEGLIARFQTYYTPGAEDECWLWQGALHVQGYGQIKLTCKRKQGYAHRIAYELACGPIPPKKQVCHTCDNPRCVNPSHLFVGTSGDNHQDMKRKNRHLFGEKNGSAVLTERQAREIFALLPLGISQRELATRYHVSQGTISKMSRGERWSHLQ